ncbi:MAG: glutaredoxin family protein [Clostridiales bacterium]|mgnify:CR=1 FL=1|nr:glutaredoxin family protein [Clostridiales bacterium]
MEKVIVYTSNTCTYCVAVKNYLREHNIEFEERNVGKTQYRKELISLGFMSVPVLKIGDEIIKGFDISAINNCLGL